MIYINPIAVELWFKRFIKILKEELVVVEILKEDKMEPQMRMPYGAFKGKEMHEIPSSYLRWLAENAGETITVAADEEWRWRDNMRQHWED